MIDAMLEGDLDDVRTRRDPVFGLDIPVHVPGVPDSVLDPRHTWDDPDAYDAGAAKLAGMFRQNFEKYAAGVSESVRAAGPNP
jgi:phosphoenolpyruvate carboxykinase (ATP)